MCTYLQLECHTLLCISYKTVLYHVETYVWLYVASREHDARRGNYVTLSRVLVDDDLFVEFRHLL